MEVMAAADLPGIVDDLADLLVDAVAGGASVGFLHPLEREAARKWWLGLESGLAEGRVLLWVARADDRVIGTVQLRLSGYENGPHRAELAKLLVHSEARGRGIGRSLLACAERGAAERGLTLLLLDTESDSPAEHLYRSAGWLEMGVVPGHALNPAGELRPTTFYRRHLSPPPPDPGSAEL
ncbi:GNAT family N-acetyltransferase [Actinokineospora diospyrosa]|uniref:Ribosomal protein S18 acetylase RimI n=1 Tax=Actinokineospora diospyrosa TaxID=103728 RepID=A0ABT1I904_9PSEU|nr:GNAT family N-acetyltransferase [Actinokineospora diospyrosa]MCP2269016.1 Ribosomal protein S18 acetylase RimI [Actinokineospora diospyrosa]